MSETMIRMEHFKNQILLLASAADVQFASFPQGAHVGDELAVGFEESLRLIKPNLAPDKLQAVEALDEYIAGVSGSKFEDFWLDQKQLRDDERWEVIRSLAREVLLVMNWQSETPIKDKATYIFQDRVVEND